MDNQTKTLLITAGLVVLILYIARPKNNQLDVTTNKLAPPKKISKEVTQKNDDAKIMIDAMRSALTANEPQSEIDKLNNVFLQEYQMKVFFAADQKLVAKNKDGKIIAREN